MKEGSEPRRKKHPVSYQEFERLMRGIRQQVRHYPQEALEEIFDRLEMIEKRHGITSWVDL